MHVVFFSRFLVKWIDCFIFPVIVAKRKSDKIIIKTLAVNMVLTVGWGERYEIFIGSFETWTVIDVL